MRQPHAHVTRTYACFKPRAHASASVRARPPRVLHCTHARSCVPLALAAVLIDDLVDQLEEAEEDLDLAEDYVSR